MNKWLFLTLVIAALFRFSLLSTVPPSPSLDEVSIGYNAYSILQTGKDEYGTPFPLLLRAYDDWRPALYVYFVIPFIKLLGLHVLSVRLPSALLSILTIFITYFLVKELVKKSKFVTPASSAGPPAGQAGRHYSLFTCFLLAISPWYIYLSRLGHEVNLGLFSDIAAAYFFLVAVQKKKALSLIISAFFFALALYSYQSQKVIVPVVVLGLAIVYGKQLWKMKYASLVATVVGVVLIIPIARISLTPQASIRYQATSAFRSDQPLVWKSREAFGQAKLHGDVLGQIINHRYLVYARIFWANYIAHLGPQWLFFGSDREGFKVPHLGLLYWWELPFVLFGFTKLFRWKDKESKRFILLWLMSSPVPAAVTTQAPHAMRVVSAVPYIHLVSALGVVACWEQLRRYRSRALAFGIVIMTASALFFTRQYFSAFPTQQSDSFQYALSQSIQYVFRHQNEYDRIVFSNREHLSQSYMFFLFWSGYDPKTYLWQGGTKSGGFEQPHAFGQFEFRAIDWRKDRNLTKTLFLGNPQEFFSTEHMAEFRYLDGKAGVVAVGT